MINDFYDIEADMINKPDRVVAGKIIRQKDILVLYIFLTVSGIFLALVPGWEFSLMIQVIAILLFVYSWKLKKTILAGNMLVAFLMSLPVIMTFYYKPSGNIYILIFYVIFSFLSGTIREIIKTAEDRKGDLATGTGTLAVVFGMKTTKIFIYIFLAVLFLVLAMFIVFLAKQRILPAFTCFGCLVIALTAITFLVKKAESKNDFHRISKWMKYYIFAGIFSMVLF